MQSLQTGKTLRLTRVNVAIHCGCSVLVGRNRVQPPDKEAAYYLSPTQQHQSTKENVDVSSVKKRVEFLVKLNLTVTGCHLSYGITQCYLPPDTSKHTSP